MLIDAHAHIFEQIHGRIGAGVTIGVGYGRATIGPNLAQVLPPASERTAHTCEMLMAHMEWAGVDKVVLLQGPFYGECNDYAEAAIRQFPDRLLGAAYLDPWEADWRAKMQDLAAASSFRAVKIEFSEATGLSGIHPEARLDDPAVDELGGWLERLGWTLTIDLGAIGSRSYQTDAVRSLAERHPHLRIVVPHLAQPNPRMETDGEMRQLWLQQIDLGLLPNVWFDSSALPAYVAERELFPFPSAARYLHTAIERIGPQKVMWGSDIPGLLAFASYKQLVQLADLHTQFLGAADRNRVLFANALEVYWS
jgi:predicted TIM-barrel fold metal-dependent hydrolase